MIAEANTVPDSRPAIGSRARPTGWSQWIGLLVFLLLCLATASLGSVWTNLSVTTWFADLQKPSWNPPNWIFGPVWTVLYVLMAVAAWLVWRRQGLTGARFSLLLFAIQLTLNAAWSGLFFGLRSPGLALAEIVLLWLAIAATLAAFARFSSWAAALLAPYLAWVTFAAVLNATIWGLNR